MNMFQTNQLFWGVFVCLILSAVACPHHFHTNYCGKRNKSAPPRNPAAPIRHDGLIRSQIAAPSVFTRLDAVRTAG